MSPPVSPCLLDYVYLLVFAVLYHRIKCHYKHKKTVIELLEQDPRPAYKNEPDRIYGMNYKGYEIRFKTADGKVTVIEVKEIKCHE